MLTQVQLRGTVSEPVLELSSQPPLDDGEILSLIVFNWPLNALGAQEQVSLARQALGLAAGLLTDRVVESLADELELDVRELQIVNNGGVVPAVTIGEQFAEGVQGASAAWLAISKCAAARV